MRRSSPLCLILAASLLILPGCASKYGEQKTSVNYYPACYQPIQDLRNREHSTAKSTAVGAGLGAVTGALVGLATTGRWQGALMGGVMGAAGGAMVGNMYGRKQQEKDDNIRLASYMQDLDGDISNLDIQSAAARSSLQCYDRQFTVLLGEIKARQITRDAASTRFAEIQSGREEAIAILGNAYQQGTNLNQEYEKAFASEQQQISTPQKKATYRQNSQTLNAARQRKKALTQKTAAISEERTAAQNQSSLQAQQINQAMAELSDIRA